MIDFLKGELWHVEKEGGGHHMYQVDCGPGRCPRSEART